MNGGLTRRQFIVASGGAGLTLALGGVLLADAAVASTDPVFAQPFLRIGLDDTVTVLAKHLDMGQGIGSGLASIVAEELDADWSQMRVEAAPANTALYKNLIFGSQTTGGSTSISNSWLQLRTAGATARAMLVSSAAARWLVPAAEITIVDGVVAHGRHRAGFGELVTRAAGLPVPMDVTPKPRTAYRLLGKGKTQRVKRLDSTEKSTGRTRFGMDLRIDGQNIAVLTRAPRFGATVKSFDDTAVRALPGVVDVVQIPNGVAVIARDSWTAISARKRLQIDWDESAAELRSSDALVAEFQRLAAAPDGRIPGLRRGDTEAAFTRSNVRIVEATYDLPYLAHAPMEPIAAACRVVDGHCEIWGGHQNQTADQKAAAAILGLPVENVQLYTLYAGGSFGRRATFSSDWVSELAHVVKATGGRYPVKLMWTREDDLTGGFYRPMNHHRLRAALGSDGRILAIHQTVVCQSFLFPRPKPGEEALAKADPTVLEGNLGQRYDVPNVTLDWIHPQVGVPVQMYRALSANHTTFAKEVFIDELARAAGIDAVEFRLRHLEYHPRQAGVLRLAAEKAGWGRPLPPHRALGLAVQESEKSFVAQVAEVEWRDGRLRVLRVVCAIDCGFVLNPDIVIAQMEGGIGFGLSSTLHGQITLQDGRPMQTNYDTYRVLAIEDMPMVDVHLVDSDADPTGVGEPGSVAIAPAVANAVARLTGQPVRALPLLPVKSPS